MGPGLRRPLGSRRGRPGLGWKRRRSGCFFCFLNEFFVVSLLCFFSFGVFCLFFGFSVFFFVFSLFFNLFLIVFYWIDQKVNKHWQAWFGWAKWTGGSIALPNKQAIFNHHRAAAKRPCFLPSPRSGFAMIPLKTSDSIHKPHTPGRPTTCTREGTRLGLGTWSDSPNIQVDKSWRSFEILPKFEQSFH